MEDIQKFKYKINYEFKNIALLKEALTHRSYSMEREIDYDNQRLEFLGDAVIEIILTDELFHKFPKNSEGHLTQMRSAMVQQEALAILARKICLGDFMMLGKGELDLGGGDRDSTLSDAFEAVVGAIYLDNGVEAAKDFLIPLMNETFPNPADLLLDLNPKGALQEYTQKHLACPPTYRVIDIDGPDHDPMFKVSVSVQGKVLAEGSATRRKNAESNAARKALRKLLE